MKTFIIIDSEKGMRLDSFLMKKMNYSRNLCQKLIFSQEVLVNKKLSKKSYILKINDYVSMNIKDKSLNLLKPVDLKLEIIYEDSFLAVINKPKNLIVHPSESFQGTTLVNGLLFCFPQLRILEGFRPGIVHRLDKNTTGLILIAKNEQIRNQLQKLIQEKKIKRVYWALIHGHLEKKGKIILPIGRHSNNRLKMAVCPNGKNAVTYFKTLKYFKDFSLIECLLETGRTHQIRVHLSYLKRYIVGDPLYSLNIYKIKSGQFLHSKEIEFKHPITNENIYLKIDLPLEFQNYIEQLNLKNEVH